MCLSSWVLLAVMAAAGRARGCCPKVVVVVVVSQNGYDAWVESRVDLGMSGGARRWYKVVRP